MTRQEAIERACEIVSMAYRSIGDYAEPSDGFCGRCHGMHGDSWHYQNAGNALEYVRKAVEEALRRDGFTINRGNMKAEGR